MLHLQTGLAPKASAISMTNSSENSFVNGSSTPQDRRLGTSTSRSMGLKLLVVCGLALLMSVPALFVAGLINERSQRALDVKGEISKHVGGPQTFLGPTLVIPYATTSIISPELAKQGVYVVFPSQAAAVMKTSTQVRHRSLFRVPVYQADLKLDGDFDISHVPDSLPEGAELQWSRAEIVIGASDPRGATADATLNIGSKTMTLVPAETISTLVYDTSESQNAKLTLLGARPGDAVKPGSSFRVTSMLRFSGAERISVLAYGKTTQLSAVGDWRNPGFDGGFLPVSRSLTNGGFTAKWSVPFIARGVRAEGPLASVTGLGTTPLGTSFIEVADPYQSVDRSLKYTLLFLGLVFLSYFMFEVTTGRRVHPAQYVLVGIAQIIFYILLLSLSERVGFDSAFLIAGSATVILLSANAGWVFSSRLQSARALAIFTALYSLIYLLLRLVDNALLVGAITSFFAIAAAMYLTREIDWYTTRRIVKAPDAR